MKPSYYNEFHPPAAAWLRELIRRGLIAPGDVDERSITEVKPDDLRPYGQVHFFAGIAGWSLALRLAGVPDDRRIWTGSCPCQPFSAAGSQRGSDDERHLWPAFFNLIRQCRPGIVFGEQVAGAAGAAWWDHVAADLEAANYAAAAANLGAHSVGAPHLRQRLYWVAHSERAEWRPVDVARENGRDGAHSGWPEARGATGACGEVCDVADANRTGFRARPGRELHDAEHYAEPCGGMGNPAVIGQRRPGLDPQGHGSAELELEDAGASGGLADVDEPGLQGHDVAGRGTDAQRPAAERAGDAGDWSSPVWIKCSDGKWRPTQRGIFPLTARLPRGVVRGGDCSAPINANDTAEARVMRLYGYGNAIHPEVAATFIRAAL